MVSTATRKRRVASYIGAGIIPGEGGGGEASEFTMTQLAVAGRTYQRSTMSGGGQNKGQGAIAVVLNVSKPGQVYARCRSVADGSTILQAAWPAANVNVGSGPVLISNIDARLGKFYLDLSSDGSNWLNGNVAVGMGHVDVVGVGQSQAVRQIAKVPAYPGTMASLGVDISPNGMVYAAVDDASITISTPTWALPSDAGPYTSTFSGEFLRRQVDFHGVECALVGYAKGDTAIADWVSGSANRNKLLAILDDVGGFASFYWHQGGNDAGAGTSAAAYKAALDNLFADVAAHNGVLGSGFTKVVTAMATRLTAGAGSAAQVQSIRLAAKEWAAANGGIYLEPHDINLEDSVHQGQPGNITLARHLHRALTTDDTGPVLGVPTRTAGSAVVSIPVTLPDGASNLVLTGSPAPRLSVFPSGQTTGALTINSIAWDNVGKRLNLTLSAAPADNQALDVYAFRHPDPSGSAAFANMIRDDRVDDGITVGRSLEPTTSGPVICAAPSVVPTVPGQMLAPSLVVGDGTIAVTRAAAPSDGGSPITGYDLFYSADQVSWTEVVMATNPQTISGLTNGTPYYVETRAKNAVGPGARSPSRTATPSAGSTVAFTENFTGANGTNLSAHSSDSGHTWASVTGTMLINANELYASAAPATYRSSYVPTSANAFVQATMRAASIITATANWLLIRSTATNTWYQGGYQNSGPSGQGWYIGKTVAGTFSVIGFAAATFAAGDSHLVRIETDGTDDVTVRLLVDGVEVISITDTSIKTAGNVGIRKSGSGNETATTGIHIDNMSAGTL